MLEDQPDLGREIVLGVATMHGTQMLQRIGERNLGHLVRWLHVAFPIDEDPNFTTGTPSPRVVVTFWRGALVAELSRAGTLAAVTELRALAADVSYDMLDHHLCEAEENYRRNRWSPATPHEIVALGLDASRRIVLSDLDLRRVVLEELDALDTDIKSSTAALDFWGTDRPKYEEDCSAVLGRRLTECLRGRGILAHREVEIRRRGGAGLGQRVDLLVSALVGERVEDAPIVEVVIEVKCCWHRDLETAMQNQLADRYLVAGGRRCGIYLLLWFGANRWTATDDPRLATCRRLDLQALTARLHQQAADLTTNDDHGVTIRAYVLDASLPAD